MTEPQVAKQSTASVAKAAEVVAAGGVVAHACEGVWGLACDPMNEAAVRRVLRLKGRPASKGLIVIGGAAGDFAPELEPLASEMSARIRDSWPGAVTWLVENVRFPPWIVGDFDTVAVRVPDHDQARQFASACGHPLVSTSANRASEPPARSAEEVKRIFGSEIDAVLPGEIGDRTTPSTIIDAASGRVLRGEAPALDAASKRALAGAWEGETPSLRRRGLSK